MNCTDNLFLQLVFTNIFTPNSDKKDYYEEALDRKEKNTDNYYHKFEKDSTKKVYETKHGRHIYGGGGITPDYIIEPEKISDYELQLRKANAYYQFVRDYMDRNSEMLKRKYQNNLKLFIKDFYLSSDDLNSFLNYSKTLGVKENIKQLEESRKDISDRLKAYIARELWKSAGWYSVLLRDDVQFQKADSLFGEAAKMPGLEN